MSAVNLISRFLRQGVLQDRSGTVLPREVYGAYRAWCQTRGIEPIGRNSFYLEVFRSHRKIIRSKRLGTKEYWVGIYLVQ